MDGLIINGKSFFYKLQCGASYDLPCGVINGCVLVDRCSRKKSLILHFTQRNIMITPYSDSVSLSKCLHFVDFENDTNKSLECGSKYIYSLA